jgi:DNA polymerase IV
MTPLAPTTPTEKHRANWLFVDLNSYFASVEQETRPELRGQPIGIIPIEANTACVIAASYQAKAYGVKTGMRADEALQLCPHLHLVQARPKLYVEYHHKIATAIERCIPIRDVMSCDEFASELMGRERQLPNASTIAYAIKQAIREEGKSLRCSIGLAPNRLLAKIAADMQKPDGLMVIERRHLPDALCCLKLSDIPGIGTRMEGRLTGEGINTVRQLYTLSRERMSSIWGSVLGDRLWLLLRGEDFIDAEPRKLQTISRQHILPPHARTRPAARDICLKLLHACAARMRKEGLWAGGVAVQLTYYGINYVFQNSARFLECQDPITLQEHFLPLWETSPCHIPASVSVAVTHLMAMPNLDLFSPDDEEMTDRNSVTSAIDDLNRRYGHHTVYLGAIHGAREEAPTRIPFGPPPPLGEF